MAAPIADRQGRKGGKHSTWISAGDWARLKELKITPGEAVHRGVAATPDEVPVPEHLEAALDLVSRLAAALARGGKVTYPEQEPEYLHMETPLPPMAMAIEHHLVTAASGGQAHLLAHLEVQHGQRHASGPLPDLAYLDEVHRQLPHPHREQSRADTAPGEVMALAGRLVSRSGGVIFRSWGDRPLSLAELADVLREELLAPGSGVLADARDDPDLEDMAAKSRAGKDWERPASSPASLEKARADVQAAIDRIRDQKDPPLFASGGVVPPETGDDLGPPDIPPWPGV
jgi:hypothetical protein